MYGQIHVIVRDLVTKKFGTEAWKKILAESGVDDIDHFMVFNIYTDAMTVDLIVATAKVLDIPVDMVLEVFGEFFLVYCMENGYDNMLRSLGDDFRTFMQNLDNLHSLLEMTYVNIEAPSFRCDPVEADGSMNLHYYSARGALLHPVVTGLLRAIGRELFDLVVTSEILAKEEIHLHNEKQMHITFHVMGVMSPEKAAMLAEGMVDDVNLIVPKTTYISPKFFCELFPFHIVIDMTMNIKQCGLSVQKMSGGESFLGKRLDDIAKLLHPHMEFTIDKLMEFINATYILEIQPKHGGKSDNPHERLFGKLTLKGQMIHMPEKDQIMFIASPRLSSLEEMQECNMYLSDIPLFDSSREVVLLNQQRTAELEVSKKLDETSAILKRLNQALDAEKQRADNLLYEMLPRKVADDLKEGKKQDAERFETATVFFSCIDTFGDIAAVTTPEEIVDLLNAIYRRFDELISQHKVYKVETVGDVYMVVGGVPERNPRHACMVADFALDIVERAREVLSPVTNLPLECMIGIHTGSICAGVVGDRCPRYCLFGDTVNVSSRMESHGFPGYIHCSPFCHEALSEWSGYKFHERGEIPVKGKGLMTTYYLIGGPDKDIPFKVPEIDERLEQGKIMKAEEEAAAAAAPGPAASPATNKNANNNMCPCLN